MKIEIWMFKPFIDHRYGRSRKRYYFGFSIYWGKDWVGPKIYHMWELP
jgi:hypothetical protein